jgi:hypothetical protein
MPFHGNSCYANVPQCYVYTNIACLVFSNESAFYSVWGTNWRFMYSVQLKVEKSYWISLYDVGLLYFSKGYYYWQLNVLVCWSFCIIVVFVGLLHDVRKYYFRVSFKVDCVCTENASWKYFSVERCMCKVFADVSEILLLPFPRRSNFAKPWRWRGWKNV